MALPIDLHSPLPLAECAARLEAIMEPERIFPKADCDRPLTGRLKGSRLRLRKFRVGFNSWQIFLFAKVTAETGGTRLRGWIGIHPHMFCVGVAVAILTLGHSLTLLTTAFWFGEPLDWTRMLGPLVPLLVFSALGFYC